MAEEENGICKCPICGDGMMLEKDKLFVCSNVKNEQVDGEWVNSGTCSYKIFKSGLSKLGKPEITADEVIDLIENGTHEFDLVSKAKDTSYTANGVIDEQYGVKINFDFN